MTFDTFDLSVFVEVNETLVGAALRQSGQHEKWFLSRSNFVSPSGEARQADEPCGTGDSYWWEWFDQCVETGVVTVAGTNIMEFTLGEGVQTTIQWEAVHDGTIVVLNQVHEISDLDRLQRFYTSSFQEWTFYLTNLKAYLEHGIDLREKTPTRNDHVNV